MIEAERLAFREEILDTWNITQCLMSHLAVFLQIKYVVQYVQKVK